MVAWAAALTLFMVYLVLITRAAAQPIKVSCNCFGITSAPVTKWTVARNALLASGAVVGLIHALGNLDDVGALGHMIAAAFVATLWGVLIANGVWLPVAAKLKRLSGLEVKYMEMIVEGVLAVQAGTSPRMVEQKLRSALPNSAGKDAKAA